MGKLLILVYTRISKCTAFAEISAPNKWREVALFACSHHPRLPDLEKN